MMAPLRAGRPTAPLVTAASAGGNVSLLITAPGAGWTEAEARGPNSFWRPLLSPWPVAGSNTVFWGILGPQQVVMLFSGTAYLFLYNQTPLPLPNLQTKRVRSYLQKSSDSILLTKLF